MGAEYMGDMGILIVFRTTQPAVIASNLDSHPTLKTHSPPATSTSSHVENPRLLPSALLYSPLSSASQPHAIQPNLPTPKPATKTLPRKASFTASFPARSSSIIPGTKGNSTITFLIWSLRLRAHTHSPSLSGEAWLYLLAVLINAVNLFLQVFF